MVDSYTSTTNNYDSPYCGIFDLTIEPRVCGDSFCTPYFEDVANCAIDCSRPICNNGYCDWGETDVICYADCGYCGDGLCTAGRENAGSCPADC